MYLLYVYRKSINLSNEEREKLILIQPQTVSKVDSYEVILYTKIKFQIAAASRIQGVTPSTIVRLLRFVKQSTRAPSI